MTSEEELQAQSPIVAALSRCTPGRLASPNLGFPTCTMGAEAVTRDLMRMGLLGGSDGPELFSHASLAPSVLMGILYRLHFLR